MKNDLFDQAPIAYHEVDCDGIIRRVNPAECLLLGVKAEDLMGKPVWACPSHAQQARSREAVKAKLAGHLPLAVSECTYRRLDGSPIIVEVYETLVQDERDSVTGLRTALLDITARRSAEQLSRNSLLWLTTALRALNDGIITADSRGLVQFMNPAAAQLTGLTEENSIGQDLSFVLSLENLARACAPVTGRRVFAQSTTDTWSGVRRLLSRSGQEHSVEVRVTPVTAGDGVLLGAIAILRQLTGSGVVLHTDVSGKHRGTGEADLR